MPGSCTHISVCGLPDSIGLQASLRVWQSFYCEGFFARCERFKLADAGEAVPPRLLPNGRLVDLPSSPSGQAA